MLKHSMGERSGSVADRPMASRPRSRWTIRALWGLLVLAVVGLAAIALAAVISPEVNWRARVLAHKLSGDLPTVPIVQLVRWMVPGSPVGLMDLARTPNPHAAIRNPLLGGDAPQRGSELYRSRCASCHGDRGHGGDAPDLVAAVAQHSDWNFLSAAKWGRPGTPMGPQAMTDTEIWQVHSYLRSLALKDARDFERSSAALTVHVDVDPMAIAGGSVPGDWLTYAGNYQGHRHSMLADITPTNAGTLSLKWTRSLRPSETPVQSSPIIANGVLFVTESRQGVVALDAATGREIWRFQWEVPDDLQLCCGEPNRGPAILGDTLFVGTLDAHLVALDAATGKIRWDAKVADYREGYSMTGAPLALGDRVVVGVAGGEFGIRGAIAAYGAADGRELWRFHTVPAPGEPGSETWSGEAWKRGGAPTWTTGAFDPERGLVFWGVGNPAPGYQADVRPGDNLYSNCVVALAADSGKLVWYFQFMPGDEHDWDSVQQPVLADIPWQEQVRPVVLWANRNGLFYALDRATGKFLFAKPFAEQNWLESMQPTGRPVVRPAARPSTNGSLVAPPAGGATNWWPPSYDPGRQLVFVPAVDGASLYFRGPVRYEKGTQFLGSGSQFAANHPAEAAVRAVDATTGQVRWEVALERGSTNVLRMVGGILSTEGGVFFVGYKEEFAAYDSDNGNKLWRVGLGGRVSGPPVSYETAGQQRIAVTAGNSLFVFGLPNSVQRTASQ
jgi:alcohol dehydrogenase (cytochrome c)